MMTPEQVGPIRPAAENTGMSYFDFLVWDGARWITMNDHLNFITGADSFSQATVARKRFTVTSSLYDGEWEVHSTKSQIQETVTIDVLGQDQTQVNENLLLLQELFDQPVYQARKITDEMAETWTCYPAEYTINAGQVFSHAIRKQVRLSIPRFPKAAYEVIE